MRAHPGCWMLGLLLLTACATEVVETPRSDIAAAVKSWPTVSSEPGASAAMNSTAMSDALGWRVFFTDPQLQDLIDKALRNNRDLRIAALNVEQALAVSKAREADFWPSLVLGLTGLRQTAAGGKVVSSTSVGLQASGYELDVFGRLRGLSDVAAAQVLAASESRRAVQIGLVAAVASALVTLRTDDELWRLAKEVEATRITTQRLVRLRVEHGASSNLDLRAADAALEAAKAAVLQAERQRAADLHALGLLVGEPAPVLTAPTAQWESGIGAVELAAGLPADVLARRPDVRQAEEALQAAQANLRAARAALFPRIVLTGTAGTTSTELSNLFKAGSWGWSVAPQLLQSVFDAGRNRAALDQARSGGSIALAQYEKSIQTAFREAADAIVSHATWKTQWQAVSQQDQSEQARLALSRLKFQHGAISQLDLLEADRAARGTQLLRLQAQAQALQSRITLYKALGGGWQ
ncbi:MAG: efflux transporter outer membrane subunit [Betaproteobacteria bacterium]|nr:efflux transporter outer membrane subunit [Betaproteobacteria bacterium]